MDPAPWSRRLSKRAHGFEGLAQPEPSVENSAEEPESPSSQVKTLEPGVILRCGCDTEEEEPEVPPAEDSPTSPAERTLSPGSLSSHPTVIPGVA